VTGVVSWLLVLEINVGRDHAIDVAGSDDDADDDTSFIDAFDVVAAPGQSIGSVVGQGQRCNENVSEPVRLTQLGIFRLRRGKCRRTGCVGCRKRSTVRKC